MAQTSAFTGYSCSADFLMTGNRQEESPLERLAAAVVLQAVKDYQGAQHTLRRNPVSTSALRTKAECKNFFTSPHFALFSDMDGQEVLSRLEALG